MGKPFESELLQLPATLELLFEEWPPVAPPTCFDFANPTYCVGSGGSQSAADFYARLVRAKGGFAWSTTPLEYLNLARPSHQTSTVLMSAGGRNKDILTAAQRAVEWELGPVLALTARVGTPLARQVRLSGRGPVCELKLPSGKDGFLATNSLIAMMGTALGLASQCLDAHDKAALIATGQQVAHRGIELPWPDQEPTFLILYAGWAASAAVDLESKLSEAALAPSMICDIRSFGHGRHHWLAKKPGSTVVVAMVDRQYEPIFKRTLRLLPANVPVILLESDCTGPFTAIDLTLKVFDLVRSIGRAVSIDPGRPGVPEFGRKIYHLAPPRTETVANTVSWPTQRKLATLPSNDPELVKRFERASAAFRSKISHVQVTGLVLDYDGTLVDTARRFEPIRDDVASELTRLLALGLVMGIATGRGKSVRDPLRAAVPESLWKSVLVGYYNGDQILGLDEEKPEPTPEPSGDLFEFFQLTSKDPWIASCAKVELRRNQLSVTADCPKEALWTHLSRLLSDCGSRQLKCLASSHSVDVVPITTSKEALIRRCQLAVGGKSDQILCIGDSGLWPGNDAELLRHFPSLSSASPTADPDSGWNLAPRGVLESEATLFYLRSLQLRDILRLTL